MKKLSGKVGFPKEYWDINYATPNEMDNVVNAKEHAQYIQALFNLEYLEIESVIDLGFGLGFLFAEVLNVFNPYRAYGIEPSAFPYNEVVTRGIAPNDSTKLVLENIDLVTWSQKKDSKAAKNFDLGLCTSVFQYLTDNEIKIILPVMAKRIRYLYFSVPTDIELKRQIEEVDFKDEYAIHRSKEKYFKLISPHFTFISSRMLESKTHFDESTTHFTDLLFRF
jgi:hypothetical protein